MKKILLVGVVINSLLSTSCSSTQGLTETQKNSRNFFKLKGDWEITNIEHSKSFKVKPFDEGVDAQCFVGSVWKLVPNNYSGSFSLNGKDNCPVFTQPIKFEVVDGNQFKFKKIMEGRKAKNVSGGYVLNLINQTETSFVLEQNIAFDGEIVKVYYNFQKK